MLSRFHPIQESNGRIDRQTDRRTDRFAISVSRVNMLMRDKNGICLCRYLNQTYCKVGL